MRQGLTVLAGAALLAAAASAEASPFERQTTGELQAICASPAELDQHFCIGFILGAGQLYAEMLRIEAIEPLACPEPEPTLTVLRDTFVGWAGAHPEEADTRAIDGMMQAAAETWPCN
ncbi:MAG: hypothetical protein H6852_06510 [Geminicoccaceae bacterium]|jgi:hypothetical protein|nr:hypothetical protein [Geminicoccaceae bacterium]MCB9967272.1 hypothetical protein [Geminicoccaceae bacterium]HRY25289.1 Rap1a/Tai family immunity protein [Geminicoccaceae bacterium]